MMVYSDPQYRSKRPLKITVLGAPGVGKTSIALQYVTNQVTVETAPTTIEDVFRKESRITVTDAEILQRIRENMKTCDNECESVLEEPFTMPEALDGRKRESADISLSLKITDTAGYLPVQNESSRQSKSFLSRLTQRKKRDRINKSSSLPCMTSAGNKPSRNFSSTSADCQAKNRLDISMLSSDGIILVYNVLDSTSFAVAREIRNRFVQMHLANQTASHKVKGKSMQGVSNKLFGVCRQIQNDDSGVPPIFLVGTHSDIRAEHMIHEKSSRLYDVSFLRSADNKPAARANGRKRKVAKTLTEGRSSIYPHDVYPVISEWKECAGFAEITSHDAVLVEQIFEQLNLAIITPKDE